MLLEKKREGTVREIRRSNRPKELSQIDWCDKFNQCTESRNIPIKSIKPNPNQPRQEMDSETLKELTISIMEYGLMQPIAVRQMRPFEYELIAGQRRLEACKSLGLAYIPAVVMCASETDSAILSLVENIQRENLNYLEEAEAFSALVNEHGLTQEELAEKLGKSQSTIANKIRILKLSPEMRDTITENSLTERHARALLKLSDEKLRKKALKIIIDRGLNVAKTDALIEEMLTEKPEEKEEVIPSRTFKDMRVFTNTIKRAVDLMRRSGIEAKTSKKESDEFIEYTIVIPKN